MKEFDAGELEGMMAERMKEELATAQRNKRRQNLNMVWWSIGLYKYKAIIYLSFTQEKEKTLGLLKRGLSEL